MKKYFLRILQSKLCTLLLKEWLLFIAMSTQVLQATYWVNTSSYRQKKTCVMKRRTVPVTRYCIINANTPLLSLTVNTKTWIPL